MDNYPFSLLNLPVDAIMTYAALISTVVSGIDYFMKNMQVINRMK